MLGKVVLRYLEGMDEPLINGIKAIIRETMGGTCLASAEGIATLRTLCQEVGCPFHDELCITTCCTALAVLWMALHKEKFPLLATSLQAAAGVIGHQRWALILPRLPRKVQRRQFDPVRRQASADIYGGAESTMPATQIEPDVLKASRLPRKVQRRQFDPVRRQASADIYGGAESTTPATQIEPDVLKVSRLPRKVQRRQFDPVRRQASADIYGGAETTMPATQIEPDVLKASRLPRKVQRRQLDPVRRQASADIYGGAESTTPATQIEPDVLKVSRLPRKVQRRQFDPVRRQASADIYVVVQKVPRLPRK